MPQLWLKQYTVKPPPAAACCLPSASPFYSTTHGRAKKRGKKKNKTQIETKQNKKYPDLSDTQLQGENIRAHFHSLQAQFPSKHRYDILWPLQHCNCSSLYGAMKLVPPPFSSCTLLGWLLAVPLLVFQHPPAVPWATPAAPIRELQQPAVQILVECWLNGTNQASLFNR